MSLPHIVYLHGLNCTRRIFTHIHCQLPEHHATFIDYPSIQAIECSYEFVLENLPKDEPISIVGHSLGGILGYLIASRNPEIIIENLISISTPFGGSQTAAHFKWIYPSYVVFKDICPSSNIIREVTSKSLEINFASIISTSGHVPFISEVNDGVISIKSQEATLAGEVLNVDSSHFEIMQDPLTVAAIKRLVFKP